MVNGKLRRRGWEWAWVLICPHGCCTRGGRGGGWGHGVEPRQLYGSKGCHLSTSWSPMHYHFITHLWQPLNTETRVIHGPMPIPWGPQLCLIPIYSQNPNGEALFKVINTAYSILGDDKKKSDYDRKFVPQYSSHASSSNMFGRGGPAYGHSHRPTQAPTGAHGASFRTAQKMSADREREMDEKLKRWDLQTSCPRTPSRSLRCPPLNETVSRSLWRTALMKRGQSRRLRLHCLHIHPIVCTFTKFVKFA